MPRPTDERPDPESLSLRSAREADVPTILRFIRELAEYEKLLDEVDADEDSLRRHLFGVTRHAEVVIARDDASGEDIGFALFFHNFSTFRGRPGIYLEDLYVRASFRGRGAGLALLRHLARLARERDCARIDWAVLDWNRPAIEFYDRLGARPLEDWITYRLTGEALERLAG
ncbi:MAG: GNAT family N-acetyltransferase [Acidobacteriota bacterium]